ncbi:MULTISPECIES: AMP-binding protein [unclassified Novosphingobium]|uniref:AMP-binding protein n=1 Tax=unclassified Novosphingobium TaxID=2644732 RepID=UPI000EE65ED1|nr:MULTISPECIES: AMP-binding protein [unclassified Novosphingobium]HCF24530.1 feruloyl-CoA synthetase [Novosphingobium sp.]HQV03344.1 AMP-binding protein [Novosphingobium sp.]
MYALQLTESYCPAQTDADLAESTVGSVLRDAAARTPDAPALHEVDGDGNLARSWTYAELLADSERLAQALLTRYQPGERIAVWAPNIPEWVIAEFALGLAGLTLVTVNPGYQPRELKYVLEQSRAVGLLLIKEFRGNPMARIAAEVTAAIPAIREVTDLEDHAALFREAGPLGSLPEVRPRDEVQIQYTSGTTSFPKGVVLHHHGITNNARHGFARMEMPHGATALVIMPLFHTGGCGMAILGGVQFGCRMLLMRQFEPQRANALIESEGAIGMMGVPTMLIAMLEADAAVPRDFGSVRFAGSGGSMVPPELIRQIMQRLRCAFYTVYGQTETSPLLTQTRPGDPLDDVLHTVGQAMPQTELSIRDPATNAVLPVGAVGEVCARAYSLMLGYNDDPEATGRTIDGDGWLHTGDLGTMDARGFVRITGRVKEMIIRGGENLFPAEIENVLLEHADVAEVAVVGVPDPKFGEAVAAFVRLAEGASLNDAALIAHCRANMAAQKTPKHWIAVSEWPLTGSGKIQKFALRDQWVARLSGD